MEWVTQISVWMIPIVIATVLVTGTFRGVPTYESFVDGAKEGVKISFSIIPYLVGMLVAITVFRASGAMEYFISLLRPLLEFVGIPADIVPLALIRPLSGTGALGMMTDIIATHGPDSFLGRLASTMQGSTDTTIYVLTVYFGAVGIKKMGDALKVGLLADLVSILASIIIVTFVFL